MAALEFGDRAAYLPERGALVVADLHVGRVAASNVEFPLDERGDLVSRLGGALDRFAPDVVVVAGDLLHAFGELPPGARGTVAAIEDRVAAAGAGLVVVRGNHDGALDAATDTPTAPACSLGDTVVCHGHEPPGERAGRYVVGHEHPALEVEGERRPCFLRAPGAYRGAEVVVLPAFSRLAAGTDVGENRSGALSPLVDDLGSFRPVVVAGDETLSFPPLAELRSFL
jgi:putative SbcD/Mre11-related phosphoesterase